MRDVAQLRTWLGTRGLLLHDQQCHYDGRTSKVGTMPGRFDPEMAVAIMRDAGVEPLDPYVNSTVPWRCRCQRCGHVVTPRLGNVRRGHTACGYCAGTAVDPEDAVAVMKAAGLDPLVDYPGSGRPWRCCCRRCGRTVSTRYAAVAKGTGCRYCAQENAGQGRRLDPEQAAARMCAAGLIPLAEYSGSNQPWACRCSRCGREVQPRYDDVRQGHDGCRWCASKKRGESQRLDAQAAAMFLVSKGLEPIAPYPGAGELWQCRCLHCGAVVTPRYTNIKQGWGACRTCAGRKSSERQRGDEAAAIAVMRAHGLDPVESYQGVMTPWRSQCVTCGREVTPLLNNIKKGQSGCGWCAGNRVDPDEVAARMRAGGLEPLTPYPGRHQPWPCRCGRCGQTVTPRYSSIARGGGCRYCNDTAIKPDVAAAAMVAAGVEPLEPYPGSVSPWRCRCIKCRRIVTPCYGTVQQGNGGCRWCRNSGFKAADAAVIYLISHEDYHAAKIGITDLSGVRLRRHRAHGWHLLAEERVPGVLALEIEEDILNWWRSELGLPPYLGSHQMPVGGWTETVDLEEIDLAATLRRIRDQSRPGERSETVL